MGKQAIVVGAGLAGLTAAYRLQQAGWNVRVIESSSQVGGRAVSVRKQGYLFDSGAVGVGTIYKDYMELVAELGLQDQVVKSSTISATLRAGKVHEIDAARPLTALTSRLFSFGSKLKLLNLFRDLAKVKPHLDIRDVAAAAQFDDESVEDYTLRRLNPELLEYFISPMIRTLNLNQPRNVSRLELMNALAGLFDTTFVTLRGGLVVLAEKLAAGLDERLHGRATAVERCDGQVRVSFEEQSGRVSSVSGDICVIATPLPAALRLYPAARAEFAPLADRIRYNRGLCVHLGYSAPTRSRTLMVMMPPSESAEIALLFLEHNKGPDRAPPGCSLITVFYDETGIERPWGLDDVALVRDTSGFVERVLPELAGRLEMSQVSRWDPGLTNPSPGLFKTMGAVNKAADPGSPVQLAGDYRSTAGQNSAIAWGNKVAANLIRSFPLGSVS